MPFEKKKKNYVICHQLLYKYTVSSSPKRQNPAEAMSRPFLQNLHIKKSRTRQAQPFMYSINASIQSMWNLVTASPLSPWSA